MAKDILPIPEPLNRRLYFNDQVTQKTIGDLTRAIIEINHDDSKLEKIYALRNLVYQREPIEIYIDSYGGYVYQCMGLIGVMESSRTPVHTIAIGATMSCGFIILISGHYRKAFKYATPMYHQVSSGNSGTIAGIEEDVTETKRLQKFIEGVTMKKTQITRDQIRENYERKQDWYFTSAKQMLDYEIVDEIIDYLP